MTLWLPWIDAGSSYRSMFTSIKDKIPVQCHTILSQDLGESERAMLVYYTGVIPRFLSSTSVKDNSLLLVQGSSERKTPLLGSDWQVIWEWHRPLRGPGPFKEIFTLYKRDGGITSCK